MICLPQLLTPNHFIKKKFKELIEKKLYKKLIY